MRFVQLKVIFKGNVQGVFFRRHVKDFAEKYNIKGYVKNLHDGCVEMVAVSDKNTLERFLNEILDKPGYGSIDSVEKEYIVKAEKFDDFRIIY